MTVKISPHKASRILQHFFKGLPQPLIAEKCGVDQATVSRYALKFKKVTGEVGIISAAKEYGIMNEVDALRSLAVELFNDKLTVEEAKQGLGILKHFNSLKVSIDDHSLLVKVIAKLKKPGFVDSALRLAELESVTGKIYSDILSEFEHLAQEIPTLETKNSNLKQSVKKLEKTINELTSEEEKKHDSIAVLEKEAVKKQLAIETDLDKKMKQVNLTLERIKRLEPVVATLKTKGITEDKLAVYLEQHQELESAGLTMATLKKMITEMNK